MIKIEHLVKNYGNNCAVDDISFEVKKGEIVGLLGSFRQRTPQSAEAEGRAPPG